ncbi:MAG: AcrR family transcriptional regulator [Oleispira sp.]|jgi:AcrR family transcriptional regulator
MGRPKNYDHQDVLKKAMMQFWKAGFAETSLSDLEVATSLNRYSLYKGFGDKETLFEQSLEYYQDHIIRRMLAPLTKSEPSIEAVNNYFAQLNKLLKGKHGEYGCLFQNSQKEGISQNILVKQYAIDLWLQQRDLFSLCLSDAKCRLPFAKEHAVQLLLAQVQSQISLARSNAPHQVLDAQYAAINALLISWQK